MLANHSEPVGFTISPDSTPEILGYEGSTSEVVDGHESPKWAPPPAIHPYFSPYCSPSSTIQRVSNPFPG